ncbi:hypothetical protein H5410_028437 [Solanum commersonii]|uniref:Uncharacterized protein n=1 Tax=Solanum commersonii TaxID=4109 RepID=A0A9J5Z240_SOLCO|nr:hypothetical protein H5410_028437 [Solanum commersonii]
MARGRGRGRERGRKLQLRSIGAGVTPPSISQTKGKQAIAMTPPMEQCSSNNVNLLVSTTTPPLEVARTLNLMNTPQSSIHAEMGRVLPHDLPDPHEGAEEQTKGVKAWTNLFAGNRNVENGMTLSYILSNLVNGRQWSLWRNLRSRRRARRSPLANEPRQQGVAHNRFAPIWKAKEDNLIMTNEENVIPQQQQSSDARATNSTTQSQQIHKSLDSAGCSSQGEGKLKQTEQTKDGDQLSHMAPVVNLVVQTPMLHCPREFPILSASRGKNKNWSSVDEEKRSITPTKGLRINFNHDLVNMECSGD